MNTEFQRAEQNAIARTGKGWYDHAEDMFSWFGFELDDGRVWDLLDEHYGHTIDPFEALEKISERLN